MNACRTFFDVIGAMGRNGRKAIRVSIPKAPTALILHNARAMPPATESDHGK
jgi:hypothetical protein